ncbi:FMRFamide receptor-like [Lineus longissimus]|uniref:FMRFamide receptor-like n=1 Tax=Lineus longissimus TaxID=88925 RepID=UPI00315D7DD1
MQTTAYNEWPGANGTHEILSPAEMNVDETLAATPQIIYLTLNQFLLLFWEFRLQLLLWKYVSPVLIFLGTVLNGLTVIVLLRRKFGKSSTRMLLIVLALADTAVLWTGLLRQWVKSLFELDLRCLMPVSCPVHTFSTYLFLHFASWLVALLTLERWISVTFPLKARVICTRKWTSVVLVILFLFLFALNSHILFFTKIKQIDNKLSCTHSTEVYGDFWKRVWYWFDLLSYSCLPFLAIAFCNWSILYKVIRGQIKRNKLQNPGGNKNGHSRQLTSMTYMLTTVSIMFILLTLPASIFFIIQDHVEIITWQQNVELRLIYAITNLLGYVNNTINFLLYCVSGTQFRREVFRMICGMRRAEHGRSSVHNPSQTYTQTLED